MKTLTIHPKGKLILSSYNYKTHKTVTKDVSKKSYTFLFYECEIAQGVVLKDIFLLMAKNIKKFDEILGCWAAEFVKEGLSRGKKETEIDKLEIYWNLFKDFSNQKRIDGFSFPNFHGVRGKRGIALDFSRACDIAHLPIVLKNKINIQNQSKDKLIDSFSNYSHPYTLGHILNSIVYELSYHGNPEQRDARTKKMLDERL